MLNRRTEDEALMIDRRADCRRTEAGNSGWEDRRSCPAARRVLGHCIQMEGQCTFLDVWEASRLHSLEGQNESYRRLLSGAVLDYTGLNDGL